MSTSSCIGVNLYSVREHCKTLDDLDLSLAKIKAIGYLNVQVSGIPHPAEKIKALLDKYGLVCRAAHDNLADLTNDLPKVIGKLKALDCRFTALGHPGMENFSAEAMAKLPAILDGVGAKLRAEGIDFGYHNHGDEFVRYTGTLFFEHIYRNTNPKNLKAEIDTYWVQLGGGCPEQWILRMKGRIPVIHLKDYVISKGAPTLCEVGEGNLEMGLILKACKKAGVRWYLVEQDSPFADRDIFESLSMSYKNLRKMGLK